MIEPSQNLGRLERVPLRDVWPHEALSFTPWLAQDDNLKLLSEAVGMELVLEAQEKGVGPFSADIVCKEAYGDRWVLIENQIERTDHSHLGQLLTYAAGLHATTLVWVAARFTDEHRAALDWLNEITNESVAFFGLEVEVWRIGTSAYAPKFNVVSKPNSWVKQGENVKKQAGDAQGGTSAWWTAFYRLLEDQGKPLAPRRPGNDTWTAWGIGRSGVSLAAVVSRPQRRIGARISLESASTKPCFKVLQLRRPEIDAKLPGLLWDERPDKVQSYIGLYLDDADLEDTADWPRQHGWLIEKLLAVRETFAPAIQSLPSAGKSTSTEDPMSESQDSLTPS